MNDKKIKRNRQGSFSSIFAIKLCPICNKQFTIFGSEWGYDVKNKYFCTYSCMRIYEREKQQKVEAQMEKNKLKWKNAYLRKKENEIRTNNC